MTEPLSTKNNRPLSPHLQIYKPQMTSLLSVLHRLTGVALAYGLFLFVWWLVAAAIGPAAYDVFLGFADSFIGKLLFLGWSIAFFFHLANGIRHFVWDCGFLFELENAFVAGYFVLFFTAIATAVTWFCILIMAGV